MASIRERTARGGRTHFQVLFRQDGRQTSLTLPDRRSAEKTAALIEALGPAEAIERLHQKPRAAAAAPTVSEWVARHIDDLTGVTDRTRSDYRRLTARHISPTLGALDVDEVTARDVAKWANDLERVVSAKTVANLRGLLSAAFGYAVDEGLREDNPLRRLRRTRHGEHERPEMVCLTPGEVGLLVEAMPKWRSFILTLAGTGLRFGEAVALTVGDVQLDASVPVIRVTKALRRTPTGFEIGPPKTRKSRRVVSLPADLVEVLRPLVDRADVEHLFTGGHGARVHHSNFHGRHWQPGIKVAQANGLRSSPRIHDLRHTHASWLIGAGVDLNVVRDRLGHESITTTVDTYSHLLPDAHKATAAALNGLLTRPADEPGIDLDDD